MLRDELVGRGSIRKRNRFRCAHATLRAAADYKKGLAGIHPVICARIFPARRFRHVRDVKRYRTDKEWRETAEAPIEEKLSDVIAEIAGIFEVIRLRREREAEEQERRRKLEEERRLAEMERKRETIRYRHLVGDCEGWRRAADIRAFVAAVEAGPLASKDVETFAGWKLWALAHADRIDPLRDEDLLDPRVEDYEVYSLRE